MRGNERPPRGEGGFFRRAWLLERVPARRKAVLATPCPRIGAKGRFLSSSAPSPGGAHDAEPGAARLGVCVGYRDRQGVGGVGLQAAVQAEQYPHHVLDLRLVCGTAADHGLLDFSGRVFGDFETTGDDSADRGAACLAELERRIRVACHKHPLDRHLGRSPGRDQFAYFLEDLAQAQREALVGEQLDGAMKNVGATAIGIGVDDADAGTLTARVDTENAVHRRSCPGFECQCQTVIACSFAVAGG